MAIQKFGDKAWACLSSDDKDAILVQEKEGGTVHIINTGEEYIIFNGAWEPDIRWRYRLRSLLK